MMLVKPDLSTGALSLLFFKSNEQEHLQIKGF